MSRTRPDEGEQTRLSYPCRSCGAHVGDWCRRTEGVFSAFLHASRYWAARDAGTLPLTGGIVTLDDEDGDRP